MSANVPGVYTAELRWGRFLVGAGTVTGVCFTNRRASRAFHSDLDTGFSSVLERVETGMGVMLAIQASRGRNFTGPKFFVESGERFRLVA